MGNRSFFVIRTPLLFAADSGDCACDGAQMRWRRATSERANESGSSGIRPPICDVIGHCSNPLRVMRKAQRSFHLNLGSSATHLQNAAFLVCYQH
jgi:hypothetical protein